MTNLNTSYKLYFQGLLSPIALLVNRLLLKILGMCLLVTSTLVQSDDLCDFTQLESTPEKQFRATNLGTVVDTTTNLEWKICMEGQAWQGGVCTSSPNKYNWKNALEVSGILNASEGFAGKQNWRLPNIKELATIFEYRCRESRTENPAIFSVVTGGREDSHEFDISYWSSSPSVATDSAWYINRLGVNQSRRGFLREVRLVRDVPVPD